MTFVAAFLASAARHLRGEGPASPASPTNPPARCTTSRFQPEPLKTRLKDQSMFALAKSPLTDAEDLSPRAIDAILAVFADGEVQRQAAAVRAKLLHIVEFAALRSEVASAVTAIGTHAADLTPATVAAVLRQRAADLDDALEDSRADRDAHEVARKARAVSMEPLRSEVSKRLTSLVAERDALFSRLDAHRRSATHGFASNSRYHALVAAGIKPEEIAGLNVEDPDEQAAKHRSRIVALDEEIAPLRRFATGGDVADLAGFGMGVLIEAAYPDRMAAEVAA